jgi:peroxiredoxin Q/BCP
MTEPAVPDLTVPDPGSVADQYDVWVEKSMYGKTYWGAKRATFVIDEDGIVRKAFKANPETHDADVLAALEELSAAA